MRGNKAREEGGERRWRRLPPPPLWMLLREARSLGVLSRPLFGLVGELELLSRLGCAAVGGGEGRVAVLHQDVLILHRLADRRHLVLRLRVLDHLRRAKQLLL